MPVVLFPNWTPWCVTYPMDRPSSTPRLNSPPFERASVRWKPYHSTPDSRVPSSTGWRKSCEAPHGELAEVVLLRSGRRQQLRRDRNPPHPHIHPRLQDPHPSHPHPPPPPPHRPPPPPPKPPPNPLTPPNPPPPPPPPPPSTPPGGPSYWRAGGMGAPPPPP